MWAYHRLTNNLTLEEISSKFRVSRRTVRRYLQLFSQTGDDVQVRQRSSFEQLILLNLILAHPGIYLHKLQEQLDKDYGVVIGVPSICRTLKEMKAVNSPYGYATTRVTTS